MEWRLDVPRAVAGILIGVFLVAQLAPGNFASSVAVSAAAAHTLIYAGAVWAANLWHPFRRSDDQAAVAIGLILIAAPVMEGVQTLIPGRTFQGIDIAFDMLGIAIGSLTIAAWDAVFHAVKMPAAQET